MKRLFCLLAALCLLETLASCGAELTPIEKCQQKVVSIGEAYLNYDITAKEAREQLSSIRVPETEGNGQRYLEADISALSFYLALTDSTYQQIEKKVEFIRDFTYE